MKRLVALCALALAIPLQARADVLVESAVFLERMAETDDGTAREVVPAARFLRGDRIIAILRWEAPVGRSHTLTSAVPPGLSLQSASLDGVHVSTDGGRNWQAVDNAARLPRGVTHLRWRADRGGGRLSYRAVVL